jgi:flagellar hook-associated protein 2
MSTTSSVTSAAALTGGVGVTSGIDYNSLINAAVEAEKQPLYRVQTQQTTNKSQVSLLQDLNTKLLALQDAMSSLKDPAGLQLKKATTSTYGDLNATATADATSGSYSVEISQLARSHKVITEGVADASTTSISAGAGTLVMKVGSGADISVNLTAGMTLTALKDAINGKNAGIKASIISDGSATNPYRLILAADSTGSANAIQITHNDTSIAALNNLSGGIIEAAYSKTSNAFDGTATVSGTYTGTTSKSFVVQMTTGGAVGDAKFKVSEDGGVTWSAADSFTTSASGTAIFNGQDSGVKLAFGAGTKDFSVGDTFTIDAFNPTLTPPQDAIFKVDGMTFTKQSNSVNDALPGVTLDLLNTTASGSSIAVTVSDDTQAITTKVQDFVAKYNDIMNFIKTNATYDSVNNVAGPLLGDFTVQSIQSALGSSISTPITGLSGNYNSLANLGIKTERDGTITLDTNALSDALAKDSTSVVNVFSGGSSGTVNGVADSLFSYLDGATKSDSGIMSIRINTLNDSITEADREIADKQERIDADTVRLKARFANLETLISKSTSDSSYLTQTFAPKTTTGV